MQITVDSGGANGARYSPFGLKTVIEIFLDPIIVLGCLIASASVFEDAIAARHVILAIVALSMTFPGSLRLTDSAGRMARKSGADWLVVSLMLLFLGYVTGYINYFSKTFLATWIALSFALMLGLHEALRLAFPRVIAQGHLRRAVIVGNNEIGAALALKFSENIYLGVDFLGFFDERDMLRSASNVATQRLLGTPSELANYVKRHRVEHIYIALPMSAQPRILSLVDDVKDTTASVFFVPDVLMIDLIQGHVDSIDGIPVVAVCETPFTGIRGLAKRVSDLVLGTLIVVLILPLMAVVAIGVRLSSRGPVLFTQRRYGLDGREIMIYKFRSMTVTEDGENNYTQVTRGDSRLTRFGEFIRKTSLDELPQFINVLQGRMSIVGPRPHAIAVNEQYRKLIPSYMIRHKVRPGITGWAQINGYRGGDDLEHMKMRVKYDLEYLRNWSLPMDFYIILKTVTLVLKDSRAF